MAVSKACISILAIIVLAGPFNIHSDRNSSSEDPLLLPNPLLHHCDYRILEDGNDFVLENARTGVVNYVASDAASTIEHAMSSGTVECLGAGTYIVRSQILVMKLTNFWIQGSGRGTVIIAQPSLDGDDLIKFYDCDDCGIENLELVGNIEGPSGAVMSIQHSASVIVDTVEMILSPDNALWIADSHDVRIDHSIFDRNGNPDCGCIGNHGGVEVDANYGANWNISVLNSVAHDNYGPGFSIHNTDANGHPNNHIMFVNDTSYNNKNYGGSAINGVGFGTYDWNNTRMINIQSYGNEYAGIFINGNTEGPLYVQGTATDHVPLLITTALGTPGEVILNVTR